VSTPDESLHRITGLFWDDFSEKDALLAYNIAERGLDLWLTGATQISLPKNRDSEETPRIRSKIRDRYIKRVPCTF